MRVKCFHGYFIFSETKVGQISDFIARYGLDIVAKDDYYTFSDLEDAPDYSLTGATFLSTVAVETFEGKPWEVFEANGMVYNFSTGLIVPIDSVIETVQILTSKNHFIANGLILPGSLTAEGLRVRDYSAWFSRDTLRFTYSEVNCV